MKPEINKDTMAQFAPGKHRRMNLTAVCLNIFLPWFLFSTLYAVMSFTMHYSRPKLAWMFVCAGFAASLGAGSMAWRAKQRALDPSWYTYAAISFFIAVCMAATCGDWNFWTNMQPFYDIENMETFPSVNPALEKGQQVMDAGRVFFADGAVLDTKKSMSFKQIDSYCVAPIVSGKAPLASYDFWAVGINCCSGLSTDFRCGEFNNPHARSGLRLMRDDQRPFFRLAVQQAESFHNLKATHPLFFYWVQDPVEELHSYRDEGFKYYMLGVFTYFAFNLFCVVSAVVGFNKMGGGYVYGYVYSR